MATKLLALRVSVNNKRRCTVALVDGSTMATVALVGSGAPASKSTQRARAVLTVSGYRETGRTHMCPWWVLPEVGALKAGDQVSLEVVLATRGQLSKPKQTNRAAKAAVRKSGRSAKVS